MPDSELASARSSRGIPGYGIPGLRCNAWGSVHTRFCADRSLTTFVVPRYTIRAGLSARIALVVSASFILTYIYKRVSIHYSRDWWFGYPPARGPLPRPRAVLLPPRMRRLYPSRAGLQVPHTYMHRYEHAFRTSENTQAEPGGGGGFLKNAYDSRSTVVRERERVDSECPNLVRNARFGTRVRSQFPGYPGVRYPGVTM